MEASLSRPGPASPDPASPDARSQGIAFSFRPCCPGAQAFPRPVPCCGDGPSCWAALRSGSRPGHGGATGCSAWSAPSQSSAHDFTSAQGYFPGMRDEPLRPTCLFYSRLSKIEKPQSKGDRGSRSQCQTIEPVNGGRNWCLCIQRSGYSALNLDEETPQNPRIPSLAGSTFPWQKWKSLFQPMLFRSPAVRLTSKEALQDRITDCKEQDQAPGF